MQRVPNPECPNPECPIAGTHRPVPHPVAEARP